MICRWWSREALFVRLRVFFQGHPFPYSNWQALKEVNSAVGGGHRASVGVDTVARLEEMQQIIHRLKEDNKKLTKQVQDAQEESWFNNLRDGQKLLVASENSIGAEMDNLTKEEVRFALHFFVPNRTLTQRIWKDNFIVFKTTTLLPDRFKPSAISNAHKRWLN